MPSVGTLKNVYVCRGFTGPGEGCEPLLSTEYNPKAKVARRHWEGAGEVFAYYGPMDMKQRMENWMVSQRIPMHFVKDCLASCVARGTLKAHPATLNLKADSIYKVKAGGSLWILNMADEARRLEAGGAEIEVPLLSITVRQAS
jgi:hypothetical protein